MKMIRDLFIANRFFYVMGLFVVLMTLSYAFSILMPLVNTALVVFGFLCIADIVLLFNRHVRVSAERRTAPVFSLGDDNEVELVVISQSPLRLDCEVIDELPEQFQMRDFLWRFTLNPSESVRHVYHLRPVVRGEYRFRDIHVFVSSPLGIVKRRILHKLPVVVPVYPSILQMKKYDLKTIARTAQQFGVKKVRRVGHSYEFEHIKSYQRGDDYRSLNWRATGRRAQLMVNQYEDERSQQVYCIIDKSRVMHMPFNGMSLFDYAVNSSLVISNIVLGKQDKAGLITFSDKPQETIKASHDRRQLKTIRDALYRDGEENVEANYERLYMAIRNMLSGRSLLLLYTNFESTYALQRALPHLRKLNEQHLLVVIFFENTEITTAPSARVETLEDIYTQITAEHHAFMKVKIAQQIRKHGMFTILTKPEHLTVNSINKYLELKSRGMI